MDTRNPESKQAKIAKDIVNYFRNSDTAEIQKSLCDAKTKYTQPVTGIAAIFYSTKTIDPTLLRLIESPFNVDQFRYQIENKKNHDFIIFLLDELQLKLPNYNPKNKLTYYEIEKLTATLPKLFDEAASEALKEQLRILEARSLIAERQIQALETQKLIEQQEIEKLKAEKLQAETDVIKMNELKSQKEEALKNCLPDEELTQSEIIMIKDHKSEKRQEKEADLKKSQEERAGQIKQEKRQKELKFPAQRNTSEITAALHDFFASKKGNQTQTATVAKKPERTQTIAAENKPEKIMTKRPAVFARFSAEDSAKLLAHFNAVVAKQEQQKTQHKKLS